MAFYDFLERAKQDIAVIVAAPWSVSTLMLLSAGAGFAIAGWGYSGTLTAKDATIETQKTIISSFRDKTGGATPDEAAKKITSLEDRIERLSPRFLSEDKIIKLKNWLKLPNGSKANVEVLFEMGCSDCQHFADQIYFSLKEVKGWEGVGLANATMVFGSLTTSPPDPLEMLVSDPKNLTLEQQTLFDAFVAIGFKMVIKYQNGLGANIEVNVNPKL